MGNKSMIQKSAGLPPPLLPAMVGAVTLSNVYAGTFGFVWIQHVTTIAAMIVWLFALIKIFVHFDVFKNEYKTTVPASLYAGFTMLMMLFGAYVFPHSAAIGKGLWLVGIGLHAAHILVFTFMNVIKGVNTAAFVPTWFVTYNGILVSVVVGGAMGEPLISRVITWYGLAVYAVLLVFMIPRIAARPLAAPLLHAKAIFLAPASLCFVGYLNTVGSANALVIYILYAAVFLSFLYFLKNIPAFFAVPFTPGFAGLTFPNAIGVVASLRMAGWLEATGNTGLSRVVREIAGIQFYITTAVIAYVLFGFIRMFVKSCAKEEAAE